MEKFILSKVQCRLWAKQHCLPSQIRWETFESVSDVVQELLVHTPKVQFYLSPSINPITGVFAKLTPTVCFIERNYKRYWHKWTTVSILALLSRWAVKHVKMTLWMLSCVRPCNLSSLNLILLYPTSKFKFSIDSKLTVLLIFCFFITNTFSFFHSHY